MEIALASLIALARQAGDKIMTVYGQLGDIAFTEKADHSPVTAADQLAHAHIASELRRLTPEIPLLSEEGDLPGWDVRQHWTRCWIADPLDGTKEFLNRSGDFSVNIALVADGHPVMAVVYFPAKGRMYYAERGKGAFCDGQPIHVRTANPATDTLKVVVSRSHYNAATQAFVERFPNVAVQHVGATLKAMLVASGEADLYPRFVGSSLWDTAAPHLIVEEAGGRLVVVRDPAAADWLAGETLRYDVPALENPTFVVIGQGWEA